LGNAARRSRQKNASLKKTEDLMAILESATFSGGYHQSTSPGHWSCHLRTSLKRSGNLTVSHGWWAPWWARLICWTWSVIGWSGAVAAATSGCTRINIELTTLPEKAEDNQPLGAFRNQRRWTTRVGKGSRLARTGRTDGGWCLNSSAFMTT